MLDNQTLCAFLTDKQHPPIIDHVWPCRYRADTTGILLVEAYFTVKATRTGPVTAALAFGGTGPSLWPSWTGPYFQFNNFNGASNSAGSITVSPVTTLGMWAWAENYDLFNTAALNGQQVSTSVRGMLVKSYGGSSVSGDTLSGCSIDASSPRAASVAIDALRRVCVVNVNAVNAVPAQDLQVTVSIPDGVSTEQTAQVCWKAGLPWSRLLPSWNQVDWGLGHCCWL
jgi:hypothetical protein